MPNWITNKVQAPEHVIRAMLNAEGRVDFNTAAPFSGPNKWDGIRCDAEEAAEIICGVPVSDHPLVRSLQLSNRAKFDIRKLDEEGFRQFVGMVENFRACGYLHSMDFARAVWGTKWNAHEPVAEPEQGHCQFETAWSCPEGVFRILSERFPTDEITVTFADEDIGSNCGTFVMLGGKVTESQIAPPWREQTDAEKVKWRSFAEQVTGRQPEPEEDESEEG